MSKLQILKDRIIHLEETAQTLHQNEEIHKLNAKTQEHQFKFLSECLSELKSRIGNLEETTVRHKVV